MYVAEGGNKRVQVMDRSGQFIREFGEGKLKAPSGLHIADKYVYVSDVSGRCIVVYETSGQFVTSFGRRGRNEGEFRSPYCITSCVDGYIHVCDFDNKRVRDCFCTANDIHDHDIICCMHVHDHTLYKYILTIIAKCLSTRQIITVRASTCVY